MNKTLSVAAAFLWLLLIGCQANSQDELNGRITLWHSWSPSEALVLEEALAEFQQIHPQVNVITVALPADQIYGEFIEAGNDGSAPGILIGRDSWISELADMGLIRPLSPQETPPSLTHLRNTALARYQDDLYGVPISLAPYALYYNKGLVSQPPDTLDDLLQEAANGNRVAFVPRFQEAYWGIHAFGDGLFDSDGRFTLAESGFKEWLDWLEDAQQAKGVILNIDDESLLELFATEQIAYYVAGPEKQTRIIAMMDEETPFEFGVVPLPQGPDGPAGPLLPAETILLYSFTSPEQTQIANILAAFLENQQQSIRFMRELDRVPANPTVRVDQRIYPITNGFTRQARTSDVIPNEIPSESLVAAGDRAYISVLSGILTPDEAVCQFGREVASFQNYTASEMSLPEDCVFPRGE